MLDLEWQTEVAGGPDHFGMTYTVWCEDNCLVVFKSREDDCYHYLHTQTVMRKGKPVVLTIVDTRFRMACGWADRFEARQRAAVYLQQFMWGDVR